MTIACTGIGGRGCPCAYHAKCREYQRVYAAKVRARKLAAANASSTHCTRRAGPGRCGGRLETRIVELGRTEVVCPRCERRKAGLCLRCPRPVYGQRGRAIYCAACHKRANAEAAAKSGELHREARLRRSREYYQLNAERRQRRNEYKKAYRAANPEKVKGYKAAYAAKHSKNPDSQYLTYQRKRRAEQRELLAARERARSHGISELRTCVTPGCDIVVTHRKKMCTKCRNAKAARGAAELARYRGAA